MPDESSFGRWLRNRSGPPGQGAGHAVPKIRRPLGAALAREEPRQTPGFALRPGQVFHHYRLQQQLGRGANATVYKATDETNGGVVALKMLTIADDWPDDLIEDAKLRLLREADAAGGLARPDIVEVREAGVHDGLVYLAMEYVEGVNLGMHAFEGKLLPPRMVTEMCARVADALYFAHQRGVIHRDIKPANIVFDQRNRRVRVMDFGVARLENSRATRTGIILGSPSYMAQNTASLQTDVRYILGVMPLRMLGSGAVYLNNIVRDNLATRAGEGAVAALNSAFATLILPQAVIAQAISTALFPTISAYAARGEMDAFARALGRALRIIIALSVPAAAALIVLGGPLVGIIFERGRFDSAATARVAFSLALYATGLVGHCVLEIVTRAFYALKQNKPPVLLGVASVLLNIALSLALLPLFTSLTPNAFVSLALANALATTAEALALFAILRRRVPALGAAGVMGELRCSALAAAVMAALIAGWRALFGDGLWATLAVMLLALAAYLACAALLKSEIGGWPRAAWARVMRR